MFERRIGSNTRASNKDGDCMAEDWVGANTPLPQSVMTNKGIYRCLIFPFRGPIYHIIPNRSMVIPWLTERAGPNIQATSSTLMAPLFDDCECMAEEYPNDNTPLP
jgi:hypothetical protein